MQQCHYRQDCLFLYEEFNDVRLVGAPPKAVGNFGGDTDNWIWPRHTGDFSIFRIYADEENNPSTYDAGNIPYKPMNFLPVSAIGVDTVNDDETFVYRVDYYNSDNNYRRAEVKAKFCKAGSVAPVSFLFRR